MVSDAVGVVASLRGVCVWVCVCEVCVLTVPAQEASKGHRRGLPLGRSLRLEGWGVPGRADAAPLPSDSLGVGRADAAPLPSDALVCLAKLASFFLRSKSLFNKLLGKRPNGPVAVAVAVAVVVGVSVAVAVVVAAFVAVVVLAAVAVAVAAALAVFVPVFLFWRVHLAWLSSCAACPSCCVVVWGVSTG